MVLPRRSAMTSNVSRRRFLAATSSAAFTSCLAAMTEEDKARLSVVPKRLEKAFKAPGRMPNDLQAASDGLWILDQVDPNKVFKVRYEDGSVISEIQTESIHGSGITYGNGALWIASTWSLKTLKVDPNTARTLPSFHNPSAALPNLANPPPP